MQLHTYNGVCVLCRLIVSVTLLTLCAALLNAYLISFHSYLLLPGSALWSFFSLFFFFTL